MVLDGSSVLLQPSSEFRIVGVVGTSNASRDSSAVVVSQVSVHE